MAPNQTVIIVEAFHRRTTTMGWNQGAWQITTFANSARRQVDIIKSYGQINEATFKSACVRFCKPGEADSQTRTKQNNTMMGNCIAKLLMAECKQDCSLTGMSTPLMGLSTPLSCTRL
jgi:hypothetical protein